MALGRVLVALVDMDANKSIHLVQTGNGKYRLRPVVRVQFMLDELPGELVRIEGEIVELGNEPGDFVLCSLDDPDTCFDVSLAPRASVFDTDGTPIEQIGIDVTFVTTMIAIVLGVVLAGFSLAFGLGARQSVANLIAARSLRRHFALGQRARFGSIEGEIVEFTPTSVILSTLEGRVHVPASQFDEQASMLLSPDGRHA